VLRDGGHSVRALARKSLGLVYNDVGVAQATEEHLDKAVASFGICLSVYPLFLYNIYLSINPYILMCSSLFISDTGVAQAIEEQLEKAVASFGICPYVYPLSIISIYIYIHIS